MEEEEKKKKKEEEEKTNFMSTSYCILQKSVNPQKPNYTL